MRFRLNCCRNLNDDYAPIDYNYVTSVNEGRRRQQEQNIKKAEPESPILRHQVSPFERGMIDEYGTRARHTAATQHMTDTVMKKLPSVQDGPAPARSIAYPEDFGIPENPFSPPAQSQQIVRPSRAPQDRSRSAVGNWEGQEQAKMAGDMGQADIPVSASRTASPVGYEIQSTGNVVQSTGAAAHIIQPIPYPINVPCDMGARIVTPQPETPVIVAEDGSQFDAPISPPMPEWLRIAQQNNMSTEERRARTPRVSAAARHETEMVAPPQTDMLGRPLRSRVAVKPCSPAGALPQTAEEYEQAGYPPELLKQQVEFEQQTVEWSSHRRHGAQYAVHHEKQQQYEQSTGAVAATRTQSYPPPREERSRVSGERGEPQDSRFAPETSIERGAAYIDATHGQTGYRRGNRVLAPDNAPYTAQAAEPRNPYAQRRNDGMQSRGIPAAHTNAQNLDTAYHPNHPSNPYAGDGSSLYGSQQSPRCQLSPGTPDTPNNRSDWQDEESEQIPMYEERAPIPWLGIACFVTAMLAVGLWLMQLTFTSQTDQVIRARKENHDALKTNHPYRYQELIEEQAGKYNLDPAFVAAIVLNESSYNPKAESGVGARGLMQLMDNTASWIYEKMALSSGYNFDDMYEAQTNVEYGCWYLSFLKDRFRGDPVLVAAGFHAGQNEVQNWLNDSRYSADNLTIDLANMKDGPTKQYATRVVRDFSIYKRIYYEITEDNS